MEHVDVERVALDPFPAVQEAAQRVHRGIDRHPGEMLEGVDRRHLVRDRADPADPGHDVEDLVGRAPDDELVRSSAAPRRSRDGPRSPRRHGPRAEAIPRPRHGSVPLTSYRCSVAAPPPMSCITPPSERGTIGRRPRPRLATTSRNGGAQPVKPANRRAESSSDRPSGAEPGGEALGVRVLARARSSRSSPSVGRAERAAAGLGDRAEARADAPCDEDAGDPASLALEADRLVGQLRPAPDGQGGEQLEQLAGGDGAAAQLRVDRHVVGDRRRGRERLDVFGLRVDRRPERVVVGPVAQRLDAAGRRAGADRDQQRRLAPELDDLARPGRGC